MSTTRDRPLSEPARRRARGQARVVHGDGEACGAGPTAVARFAPAVELSKEEVYDVCAALALGEAALRRGGREVEAAHLGRLFDTVEGRLAQPSEVGSSFS